MRAQLAGGLRRWGRRDGGLRGLAQLLVLAGQARHLSLELTLLRRETLSLLTQVGGLLVGAVLRLEVRLSGRTAASTGWFPAPI